MFTGSLTVQLGTAFAAWFRGTMETAWQDLDRQLQAAPASRHAQIAAAWAAQQAVRLSPGVLPVPASDVVRLTLDKTVNNLANQVGRSLRAIGVTPAPMPPSAALETTRPLLRSISADLGAIPARTVQQINALAVRAEIVGPGAQGIRSEIAALVREGTKAARLKARDKMGELMWATQREVYAVNGITKAQWHTQRDSRVRRDHRVLEGVIFDVEKGAGPKHLRPGMPINCRCYSTPVLVGAVDS